MCLTYFRLLLCGIASLLAQAKGPDTIPEDLSCANLIATLFIFVSCDARTTPTTADVFTVDWQNATMPSDGKCGIVSMRDYAVSCGFPAHILLPPT